VPHETLRKVTENHPHLGRLLWLLTNIDAAMHRKWIASLGQRHGPDRLAHLICELFLRLEAVNQAEGYAFAFPITQADLADALGYSIVHTNRMVQQLRREGLIKWEGHRVEILNWPALVRRGKFDPQYLYLTPEPR
jgi:CRP-like cAMP-binding protein